MYDMCDENGGQRPSYEYINTRSVAQLSGCALPEKSGGALLAPFPLTLSRSSEEQQKGPSSSGFGPSFNDVPQPAARS